MENKIINLNYIKLLNEMNINKFEIDKLKQFQNILDKVFLIPIEEHFLFKSLYNKERYIYSVKIDDNKATFSGRNSQKLSLTINYDLSQEKLISLFFEDGHYNKFVYFNKNFLYIKYKNNKKIKKLEINEHLVPIKNKQEFFPNGNLKKEEIFHSEHAIRIETLFSLKGKIKKKYIELRKNNFILITPNYNNLMFSSNNINIQKFCEEHVENINEFEEILPLIELNFL